MRRARLVALVLLAACHHSPHPPPYGVPVDKPLFGGDRARSGWNASEAVLTPERVAGPGFGAVWSSAPFDSALIDGKKFAPHAYASPLYVDRLHAVIVATSNGWVYAVRAFDPGAGEILWRASLVTPAIVPKLDGGVPLGVLSTPAIDLDARRLYATAFDAAGWHLFALELDSGKLVPGWPVDLADSTVAPRNANPPALFAGGTIYSQRSALNLSPRGDVVYVSFGSYYDGGVGWMVAVDTAHPSVAAAFSSAPSSEASGNGGIWSAGGSVVDGAGRLFATTGNSPEAALDAPGVWGETLLRFSAPLVLDGSYTPFNYCRLDASDSDLGGSSPSLLPELDPASTTTPNLVVFGGKQGTVYLVDRDRLPGRLDRRPACGTDSSADGSLLAPGPQPQFGARGPLNVFGPYTDVLGNYDTAKMRSTPAWFRDAAGRLLVFVAGSTKAAADPNDRPRSSLSVPPCLARLQVVTEPGAPAYLALDRYEATLTFENPGSPVVSSLGPDGAIVWVLDENAKRTAPLDPSSPHPVLYAVDATTMKPLWRSTPDQLQVGGKYSEPAIVRGLVIVATDRVTAFGLR